VRKLKIFYFAHIINITFISLTYSHSGKVNGILAQLDGIFPRKQLMNKSKELYLFKQKYFHLDMMK